jgi:hypothetical protein
MLSQFVYLVPGFAFQIFQYWSRNDEEEQDVLAELVTPLSSNASLQTIRLPVNINA